MQQSELPHAHDFFRKAGSALFSLLTVFAEGRSLFLFAIFYVLHRVHLCFDKVSISARVRRVSEMGCAGCALIRLFISQTNEFASFSQSSWSLL